MKLPFLVWVAILLQEATNLLCARKFSIALGVLKHNNAPAIVLTTKRLLGKSERLLMDVYSFIKMANEMAKTDDKQLERHGFVINKKDKMDRDFVIPSWAFPRAQIEVLLHAEEIAKAFKAFQESAKKLESMMKAAGFTEEELDKLKKTVLPDGAAAFPTPKENKEDNGHTDKGQ